MLISTFRTAKDNQPVSGDAPWEIIARSLGDVRETACTLATCTRSGDSKKGIKPCPHKDGMAWSPAHWPDGAKRAKATVISVSALVVDLDHLPPHVLPDVLARVQHLEHVAHGSHSDRPDDRCVRLVITISRPVLNSEWSRFWRGALTQLNLPADTQTCDSSRLYFLPSRPKDATSLDGIDGSGFLFYHQPGVPLDVDAVLAAAPPEPVAEPGDLDDFEIPDFHGAPPVEQLEAAIEALGRAWPSRRRNEAHLALMGGLARAGWPAELIANFCAGVAELQQRGNSDLPKRFRDATATVEKLLSGTNVVGWTRLRNILDEQGMPGEAAILEARRALGFPDPVPTPDPTFVAAITALAPKVEAPKPPPAVAITGDLKAAQKRLARSTKGAAQTDAELLQRVLRSEIFTNEDEIGMAAVAVARYAPPGTSPEQVRAVLLPCLSGTYLPHADELVAGAMQTAATTPPPTSRRGGGGNAGPEVIRDPSQFEVNPKTEKPDATSQHNMRLALHKLEVTFKFDLFANREIMIREGVESIVEDHHIDGLAFECEENFGFYPNIDKFFRFCAKIARERSFHPVVDYLDTLAPWDGVPRVETWLIDLAGAPDTAYVRAVSRLILVAAVRRVRKPGCKFDEMLILETPEQGRGKSMGLKALCPNPKWFTDDFMMHQDTKRMLEMTDGKWIVEAGELKGMSQGDHNAMKQYLSRGTDEARMAYGRKTRRADRQFVIIGTTNDEQYLKDLRNRRYWPVRVVEFNVEKLIETRDQLWAEALALDIAHPEESFIRLDPSLYGDASTEQDKRRIDDPFEVALDEVLGDVVGILNVKDAYKICGYADKLPNKSDAMAIANALRRVGFERMESRMVNGTRGTYYARSAPGHQGGADRNTVITIVGTGSEWRVKMMTGGPVPAAPSPALPFLPGAAPHGPKPVN